ncbi:MAG: hypothetical protein ABJA82_09100 [Myxococcales bacterium]
MLLRRESSRIAGFSTLKAASVAALVLALGACDPDLWDGHSPGQAGSGGSTTPPSGSGGAGGGDAIPTSPCAAVLCKTGTICEVQEVQCVKAPCPPIARCVPIPASVRCGGIAGIACPGLGRCVDDPADSCDPTAGGADCGGICECHAIALCVKGSTFDISPKICTCVPTSTPVPPPALCPVEKCPTPGPKSVNYLCPDGKTTGGPACVVTPKGICDWTIVACPAK